MQKSWWTTKSSNIHNIFFLFMNLYEVIIFRGYGWCKIVSTEGSAGWKQFVRFSPQCAHPKNEAMLIGFEGVQIWKILWIYATVMIKIKNAKSICWWRVTHAVRANVEVELGSIFFSKTNCCCCHGESLSPACKNFCFWDKLNLVQLPHCHIFLSSSPWWPPL